MAYMSWQPFPEPGSFGQRPLPSTDRMTDTHYQSWRPFPDTGTKDYYEKNPTEAWRQYLDDLFGVGSSPLHQYASQYFGRAWANYLKASEERDDLMWVDYLTNDLDDTIKASFYAQPAQARGETLWFMPQGRSTR